MPSAYDALLDPPGARYDTLLADKPKADSPYDVLLDATPDEQAQTNLENYLLTKEEVQQKFPSLDEAGLMEKRHEFQRAYDTLHPVLSSGKPIVPIPKPDNTGIASGIVRGAANIAEGIETPNTLMTIAAAALAPETMAPLISGAFSADAISYLPEQAKAIVDADTAGKKAEAATEMVGGVAVAALAGAHSVKGARAVVRKFQSKVAPLTAKALNATQSPHEHSTTVSDSTGSSENRAAQRQAESGGSGDLQAGGGLPAEGRDAAQLRQAGVGSEPNPAPADLAPLTTQAAASPGKVTQLLQRRQKVTDPEERQRLWDEAQEEIKKEGGEMKLGGGESGGIPLEVVEKSIAKIPGAVPYAKGWVARVAEFGRVAKSLGRMVQLREQRDIIPALYDAAQTKAGYVANQARSSVRLEAKSELARKAATFVAQANGDREGMLEKFGAIRNKGYDDVLDYAVAHWDELEPVARKALDATNAAHEAAQAAGIDLQYREGYVKGAYEEYDPANRKVVFDESKGGGSGSTSFRKSKVFNDYAEAIAAGYEPQTLDLGDLTQSAVLNVMRKVNQWAWVDALGKIEVEGKPLVTEPLRVTGKDSTGAIVHHGVQAPDGYRLVSMPEGTFAVQEDLAPLVQKLTDPSHFPKILAQIAGGIKHNVLSYDIYHGSRFAQMQMAFEGKLKPSYRAGHSLLEYADKDLDAAVAQKEITPQQAKWARENRPLIEEGISVGLNAGRISDALFKDIAPLWPGAKATSKFIFDKLSRGIITESYVYAFKRNLAAFPDRPRIQVARQTAREINTFYRNLGNQGVLKSKTWQDFSRSVILAPQWLEGRVTSEAKGAAELLKAPVTGRVGNVGKGMATGLLAYFAANQLINMLTRGQPTWKNPESGHKLDAYIPDVVEGGNGYFISPLSVFAETTHDVEKQMHYGTPMLNIPLQLGKAQLSPGVQSGKILATGEDFYGRELLGLDRFLEAAKVSAPAPLIAKGDGRKGGIQQRVMSFGGLKATPAGSFTAQTYGLAHEWLRANEKEKPKFPPSAYGKLNAALIDGDRKRAKTEYRSLAKRIAPDAIDTHYQNMPTQNFTGSNADEAEFVNSLSGPRRDIYDKALKERAKTSADYFEMRNGG